MNINAITGYKNQASILKQNNKPKNISFTNAQTTPLTEDDYNRAQKYLEDTCKKLTKFHKIFSPRKFSLMHNFDLDKLNGIQYGINLFDGMTMKEVAFVLQEPNILLNRGCNNLCSHCYINALPSQRLEGATSVTYEDFEKLIKGISELRKRISQCYPKIMPRTFNIEYLFRDSDCINIEIKDKNNKSYDIVDCFDFIRKNGIMTSGNIDTSGWTPSFEKHQKRAEKLVEYIKDTYSDNDVFLKPIRHLMVSINPFHSLYQQYINLKDSNPEKAQKYRDLYVNRMANTLYTFSPLFDVDRFAYNLNILSLNSNPNYNYEAVDKLVEDILNRLKEIYDEKNVPPRLKEHYMNMYTSYIDLAKLEFRMSFSSPYRQIIPTGRASVIMKESNPDIISLQKLQQLISVRDKRNGINRCIQPNGKVDVFYNDNYVFPTDIQFNFAQKNKTCPPLADKVSEDKLCPNGVKMPVGDYV